jgi:hypothetical protein
VELLRRADLVRAHDAALVLRSRFESPPWIFGALVVYALWTTLLLRAAPPEFDAPADRSAASAAPGPRRKDGPQ